VLTSSTSESFGLTQTISVGSSRPRSTSPEGRWFITTVWACRKGNSPWPMYRRRFLMRMPENRPNCAWLTLTLQPVAAERYRSTSSCTRESLTM